MLIAAFSVNCSLCSLQAELRELQAKNKDLAVDTATLMEEVEKAKAAMGAAYSEHKGYKSVPVFVRGSVSY